MPLVGSVAELVKALDLSPNGVTYREFESRRYHGFFFFLKRGPNKQTTPSSNTNYDFRLTTSGAPTAQESCVRQLVQNMYG